MLDLLTTPPFAYYPSLSSPHPYVLDLLKSWYRVYFCGYLFIFPLVLFLFFGIDGEVSIGFVPCLNISLLFGKDGQVFFICFHIFHASPVRVGTCLVKSVCYTCIGIVGEVFFLSWMVIFLVWWAEFSYEGPYQQ